MHGHRLAAAWLPDSRIDPTTPPDLVVPQGGSLQGAVDRLVARGGTARRYVIALEAGIYAGPVVIPPAAPPIDIRGAGAGRSVIAAAIDAGMTGADYARRFAPVIRAARPASRAIFDAITPRATIGTGHSAVLRVCSDGVRLSGLTLRNDYGCDRAASAPAGLAPDAAGRFAQGQHQAVALMLDGADRCVVADCALSGYQDTLYLKQGAGRCARALFAGCEIAGDVDFIFGDATALFTRCTIRARRDRTARCWALAPSTSVFTPYGFVFQDCHFTCDAAPGSSHTAYLGRQWFEGVRATPYGGRQSRLGPQNRLEGEAGQVTRASLESVGKAALFGCRLGAHLDPAQLWDSWGSGARFRPVQYAMADMLELLGDWLPERLRASYASLPATPWLFCDDACYFSETTGVSSR